MICFACCLLFFMKKSAKEIKEKRPGHKVIVKTHNGTRYQLMCIAPTNKYGQAFIDTIYCDWDIKGVKILNSIKSDEITHSDFAKVINQHFKKIKKQAEELHPNLLLVINNPEEYVGKNNNNHLFCNATIYIPTESFSKKSTLQSWTDEVIEICEEVKSMILDSIDK